MRDAGAYAADGVCVCVCVWDAGAYAADGVCVCVCVCVCETPELMQRTVDICGGQCGYCGWILLSLHILLVLQFRNFHIVTHTAVSSPKCNSEKRPLSNSVAFQTLFKWHRYCGILKIHIVRKINTGIRYEPVYRPALIPSNPITPRLALWIMFTNRRSTLALGLLLCLARVIPICCCLTLPLFWLDNNS